MTFPLCLLSSIVPSVLAFKVFHNSYHIPKRALNVPFNPKDYRAKCLISSHLRHAPLHLHTSTLYSFTSHIVPHNLTIILIFYFHFTVGKSRDSHSVHFQIHIYSMCFFSLRLIRNVKQQIFAEEEKEKKGNFVKVISNKK